MWAPMRTLAGLAVVTLLVAVAAAQEANCPERCQETCKKECDDPFNYDCAQKPWKYMEVCAWDGRRYSNECCARCAGSSVRAYCAVPLALATFPNSNPKLCTLYCNTA